MNYKPAFTFPGQAEPSTNSLVFATEAEALTSAARKFSMWTMPTGYLSVLTTDPVNYMIDAAGNEVRVQGESK